MRIKKSEKSEICSQALVIVNELHVLEWYMNKISSGSTFNMTRIANISWPLTCLDVLDFADFCPHFILSQ